jgi:hypothetical protein
MVSLMMNYKKRLYLQAQFKNSKTQHNLQKCQFDNLFFKLTKKIPKSIIQLYYTFKILIE